MELEKMLDGFGGRRELEELWRAEALAAIHDRRDPILGALKRPKTVGATKSFPRKKATASSNSMFAACSQVRALIFVLRRLIRNSPKRFRRA